MTRIEKETQKIRERLASIIGETTVRNHFYSYYGIFKDGIMFALYKEGKLYLKLASQDIENMSNDADIKPLIDPQLINSEKYFHLPEHILNNLIDYQLWLQNSILETQSNRYNSYYRQKQKIRNLPNMNLRLEKYLNKINIHSVQDLVNKGAIKAFVELIKLGIDANHNTLFRLYGALHHQLIYTIPEKTKNQLLQDADDALYDSGLRRRFQSFLK